MTDHQVTDMEDNRQQVVLKPEHFTQIAAAHLENLLEEKIRQASEREAEVLKGLETLRKRGLHRLVDGIAEWEEDNGLIYHRGRVYVPPEGELRKEVLQQCHDHPTAGHPGPNATLDLVSTHYWWPTL